MRVAIISPEYYEIAHFGEKRKEIPPFGALYLAAILEQYGIDVTLFRVSKDNYQFDFTEYNIIGFSISSSVTYPIIKKVREFSQFANHSLLIAGGIHTTIFPEIILNDLRIDISCVGESEITILEIIKSFDNRDFSNIYGIVYKNNLTENIIHTPKRDLISNLDSIPFPARHLLPEDEIVMNNRLSNTDLRVAHIICSRGCPYNCNFCANQEHGIRYRSGSNIRKELELLVTKYRIEGFCVTDDNFIIDKNRIIDICNEISPLGLKWSSLSRVNTIDKTLLNHLKQSGCIEIKYGIESGSQRILNLMNKKISINQIREAVKNTFTVGIRIKAFILHGFPGENLESTRETIQLLDEIKDKIDRISLFRFVPLPGSPVYNNFQEFGVSLPENFNEIYIYNNERKWWGSSADQREVEESFQLLENYIKENWENH